MSLADSHMMSLAHTVINFENKQTSKHHAAVVEKKVPKNSKLQELMQTFWMVQKTMNVCHLVKNSSKGCLFRWWHEYTSLRVRGHAWTEWEQLQCLQKHKKDGLELGQWTGLLTGRVAQHHPNMSPAPAQHQPSTSHCDKYVHTVNKLPASRV